MTRQNKGEEGKEENSAQTEKLQSGCAITERTKEHLFSVFEIFLNLIEDKQLLNLTEYRHNLC